MEIVNECKSHRLIPCGATPDAQVLGKVKTCSRWFHSQIIAIPELTLDMNSLKKATFNEVFIYAVCNYHGQSMVTTNMQYKCIDTKQTIDKHKTKDCHSLQYLEQCSCRNLFAYGSTNLPIFWTPEPGEYARALWLRRSGKGFLL